MSQLAITLFGAPRITHDGVMLSVDTRKAIALLAFLAVTHKPQARDTLVALLWPDYEQAQARASLRRTLSALGKALNGPWLDAKRETIGLNHQASLWTDTDEFMAHLAAVKAHAHAPGDECDTCLDHLVGAANNYTDDFLAGFGLRDSDTFEEWQLLQREDFKRQLSGALERLVSAYALRGAHEEAIVYGRRWLALDRLHEPAYRALMDSYSQRGQYAAAMHQYRQCVQVLERELGVTPLAATTQLYETILKRRLHSASQAPSPSSPPVAQRQDSPPRAPSLRADTLPLVGRSQELASVRAAYDSARSEGRLFVIDGEAGIGKTRLANEFLLSMRQRAVSVLEARCYTGEETLAYGPILAALRVALAVPTAVRRLESLADVWVAEASRLVPELQRVRPNLPPSPRLDSPGAQSRFIEGLCHTLCALSHDAGSTAPGVLFIDDAHWIDSSSLRLLTYLVRRPQTYPLFILLCWRSQDSEQGQRLRALLTEAPRAGAATSVALHRLGVDAIRELARASLPQETRRLEALAQRLHKETEGVPIFLVEYLTAVRDGALSTESDDWTLPGTMREALLARIHTVSETGWQALTAAAVIGRSFDVDTLREASGRTEEETVSALDELSASGLVNQSSKRLGSPPLTYDFVHEKVRAAVCGEVSLARQRLLHRRIATALVARYPRDRGALAVQIATHYREAGQDTDAAIYFQLAGERARALYANSEALTHLETARALGHPDPASLHEAIGDLHTLQGAYTAALRNYETAAALSAPDSATRLEWKLSGVYARRGDWDLAEGHLANALTAWDENGLVAERASAYADWSLIVRRQGDSARAQEFAEQALALALESRDAGALAKSRNMLGALATSSGRFDEARAQLEQSLALSEGLDDLGGRIATLNNLSLLHAARDEAVEAQRRAEQALALCIAQGDRHREAALRTNLADRLRDAGDIEAAIAQLKVAVSIFAEIGADAGDLHPEIWKLTDW